MLMFTNRHVQAGTFGTGFTPGGTSLSLAEVHSVGGGWAFDAIAGDVADDAALQALVPRFAAGRPVLVYLHGNNNTPADCFARCARLEALYGVETLGFSWPAEGHLADGQPLPLLPDGPDGDENQLSGVAAGNRTESGVQRKLRRYRQAKTNAQDGVDALARFLRLLGTARLYANGAPFTLAAHSLGAHFLQYTLDVPGAAESLGTAHNVVLLAPCVRSSGHREWLGRIRPRGQVFVTLNRADSVLFGAYIADGAQLKLGADPETERLVSPWVRYIDFTNARVDWSGHGYFVTDPLPGKTRRLFKRLFSAERDLGPGEAPRATYPFECDPSGLTCYMGRPDQLLPP